MNSKQMALLVSAVVATLASLGVGGASLMTTPTSADIDIQERSKAFVQAEQIKGLGDRLSKIEVQVEANGKGIAEIIGYLRRSPL